MACALNQEQVLDVYEILIGDILELGADTPFQLDTIVKDLYNAINDKEKAVLYAQATPDILNLVLQDDEANEKLVMSGFDFTNLAKMRVEFNDLDNVSKFVAQKKRSKKDVKSDIEGISKGNAAQRPKDSGDEKILWSYNENEGAKVVFPLATTSQIAYSENPEEVSEEKRNEIDPEKKLFYDVIKDIVYISRQQETDSQEIIYGDTSLALVARRASDVDPTLLTSDDRNFLEENPESSGILSIISDTEGNPVFFDEGGNITTEDKGRIVYTYLRRVNLVKDKLLLSNRSNRHYNLVEPEVIVSRLVEQMESQPKAKKVSKKWFDAKVKEIRDKQEKEMNDLYTLRNHIMETGQSVILPIIGGSFGIPTNKTKTMSLAESGISLQDIKQYQQITTEGKNKGKQFIMLSMERPGLTVDQQIFLQRGDITSALADKIADVLTTNATLKGKQLTPEDRKNYFEIFINNAIGKGFKTNRDRITAKVRVRDNEKSLVVTIKGQEIAQDELYTEETRNKIKEHLMNAIDFKGVRTYPANVQFNSKYKNGDFDDYVIDGDKITVESKNYFDFIKPFIKIEYQDSDNAYMNGLNAYMNYSIPEGFNPEDSQYYKVGRPVTKDKTKVQKRFEKKKNKKKDKDSYKSVKEKKSIRNTNKVQPAAETKPKTKKEAVDKAVGKGVLLADILSQPSRNLNAATKTKSKKLNRDKTINAYLNNVFSTKKDRNAAETWWANSPLSKHIELERITEIVNSDAYATWQGYGITLYEGDGGTAVDLYHEAWHGFSQLFLSVSEKTSLYNKLMENNKWKNKTFLEIEEDLAEDFRRFAKSKGKIKRQGVVGRIFNKIYNFLKDLFTGVTKKEVITRPSDIPVVKELFDKLYRASENPEIISNLKPSMNNIMFTELNRLKTINENFTIDESVKISNTMDNIVSHIIKNFNRDNNTTAGALKILRDTDQKIALYDDAYAMLEAVANQYEGFIQQIIEEDQADAALLQQYQDKFDLIKKAMANYGDPVETLDGDTVQANVINYHIEKSIYKVLADEYIEVEDPSNLKTTTLFKKDQGNNISARELAGQDTLMLLASIVKTEKDENGNLVEALDYFGIPQIQNIDITWNRLSKILEGSFNDQELYNRILENADNYPELEQLSNLLPNPGVDYRDSAEFDLETSFWQDFKKPRLPYIQLNLNTEGDTEKVYEARVMKANFDTRQVMNDWTTNFKISDKSTNPYVNTDKLGRPVLNTKKIIKDFSINGQFNYKKANRFLKAVGIELDMTSTALKNIVNNRNVPFSNTFGIDRMFQIVSQVDKLEKTYPAEAYQFKINPLRYFREGLPKPLRLSENNSQEVSGRIKVLAELQNTYSDKFSNFSVQSAEGNRVWEHFLDNTITRMVTSINYAETWQELTGQEYADPDQLFKHMYWMNQDNNTMTQFSVLLKSIFHLDQSNPETYGKKKDIGNKLKLQNVSGTQLIGKNTIGSATASTDATSKYLQEFHTMLLSGVEEFMRHASKNTAQGLSLTEKIQTYNGKRANNLYVDIEAFMPGAFGTIKANDILMGYIAGEGNRIFRYKSNKTKFSQFKGYNRPVKRKGGKSVDAAEAFTAFDDVLSAETQKALYKEIDTAADENVGDFNLMDILNNNEELRDSVSKDLDLYFEKESRINSDRLTKAKYLDQSLLDRIDRDGYQLTPDQLQDVLATAYTYNSWIHKFETTILAYGDAVQYNHAKEEFHKRNAGLGSGGRSFRSDLRAQAFINDQSLFKKYYADRKGYKVKPYDGTFTTAILKEYKRDSIMYDEYIKQLEDSYYDRLKNRAKAKKLAKIAMGEYFEMKVGDGQGHITFEAYRTLKKLENNWTDNQERLYRKVSLGQPINVEDVVEYFPPYKLQYFGNIQTEGLPLTSFHKFSLAPMVPGVAKEGTPLAKLHDRMMKDQVDYVTFESGSKVGHIGSGDTFLNQDGTFNENATFTKNVIFAEYLKNQTEVNPSYKGKSIFSTQMRKLILEGLYTQGVIDTTDESKITEAKVKRYLDHVADYTELLKYELLEEIGFKETGDGEFVAKDAKSRGRLANLIRSNLEREDVLSDDLIEFIDVFENDGEMLHDVSFHPDAAKIEKILLSVINKRIIKPKVKGEPLVQVSSALYENQLNVPVDLKNASQEDIKKYVGTNLLPTYHGGKGKTNAMKVMVAMQGDYFKLFKLPYDLTKREKIEVTNEDGSINVEESTKRLNEKLKDDKWLDANDGANRKAVTMVGVRIPVQGLNSMEFMEVYEFLPPTAGNIVVVPAEIVAKSGGDFDIDKLTIFMGNLNKNGRIVKPQFSSTEAFKKEMNKEGFDLNELKIQKAGLENEMINDIREILEMPHNYASLITPNGTFLLKELSDRLAKDVMEYDPLQNRMSKERGESISPTRIFEAGYNLYKHESNAVGKRTLGLGAIENTFNVIMNAAGAKMPSVINIPFEGQRDVTLYLRHNKFGDTEQISLSDQYDVNNENKVADVISQMMNGWVDVEKDAWIFFIQGNYEVAPQLMYLTKAGVPVEEAVYFVSNPLVREYVEEQRLAKSTFGEVLGKKPAQPTFTKYQAAKNVIKNNFDSDVLGARTKNRVRHETGEQMIEDLLSNRKDKHFNLKELKKVVESDPTEMKKDKLAQAMFLHYLSIEKQVSGLTALKMSSNPDTSTKSTISDVEQTEANLDEIREGDHAELLESFMNDSVISSFFNGPLALALSRPLFKLRFHRAISDFLIVKNEAIRNDLQFTFPGGTTETFLNVFRNDIVSFLFQNSLRRYKLGDTYMSHAINKSIPVKLVSKLDRGAFVKDDVLYVDEKEIKREFKTKSWETDSEAENNYEDKRLYPLNPSTFMQNGESNYNEYLKFVLERETLRPLFSFADVTKTQEFAEELKKSELELPEESNQNLSRYTYERILANKALDNTYNFYHLFNDPNYSMGVRLSELLIKYPDLASRFEVLQRMRNNANKDETVFNIEINDKDYNNDKSNLYTKNLADLADISVIKSTDSEENARITDFFNKLKMFGFLQSGINKESVSITNVLDYRPFVQILETEVDDFIKALDTDGNKILDNFYKQFLEQNAATNKDKRRYKDYLSLLNYKQPSKIKDVAVPTRSRRPILEDSDTTNLDTLTVRQGLKTTTKDKVFTYNDAFANSNVYYNNLMLNNQDVVFIHNTTLNELKSEFTKSFGGQTALATNSSGMAVNFPTGNNRPNDAMEGLSTDEIKAIQDLYERRIAGIKELLDGETNIAFPETGIGTSLPQELFVYLSKRLFEEFQYVNPGSTMYDQVNDLIGTAQGITDQEILSALQLEEDPFKC